jgi:hypothetical protein
MKSFLAIKDLSEAEKLSIAEMSAVSGGNSARYGGDDFCGTPVPKHIPINPEPKPRLTLLNPVIQPVAMSVTPEVPVVVVPVIGEFLSPSR